MEAEELLELVDIYDYVSQYVEFEEKGGEFWALSPFKQENTPSFSVNTDKQMFYDFSSGAGGNLIHFIRKYHKCGYNKALEILRKYAGIEDGYEPVKKLEATKIAKKYSRKGKELAEIEYPILPSNYMDRFDFDINKLWIWVEEGINAVTLKYFDVRYDVFSNRIVYPLKNYDGEIINVCGRTLDPDYKAKGQRKYTYFRKFENGILDTLYGFSDNKEDILQKKEIILFEGAKSVMKAHSWGIRNTAAICTSHLNPYQLKFLIKLGVKVVFALDEDVDVKQDENIQKLKRFVNVESIVDKNHVLESKMAPVDMGKEIFEQLYAERQTLR